MALQGSGTLTSIATRRAVGRMLITVLAIAALTWLFSSEPTYVVQAPIAAEGVLQFAGGPPAPPRGAAGTTERFTAASVMSPKIEAEPDPPRAQANAPGALESMLPEHTGRFVLDQVTNSPLDASVSESVVARYRAPDNAVAVYGGAVANSLDDADTVRRDVVKTFVRERGMTVTRHEYGQSRRGEPIVIAVTSSATSFGKVWSTGRLIHLAAANSQAILDEFLGDWTLWPEGNRIAWDTDLFGAYRRASTAGKPLVVYFYFETCNNCALLARNVLGAGTINGLAGQAVFAQVDVEKDDDKKNISRMVTSLGLESYPVVAVLDASVSQIKERGRIAGYIELGEFTGTLGSLLAPAAAPSIP
jgi:hypothetical protein